MKLVLFNVFVNDLDNGIELSLQNDERKYLSLKLSTPFLFSPSLCSPAQKRKKAIEIVVSTSYSLLNFFPRCSNRVSYLLESQH